MDRVSFRTREIGRQIPTVGERGEVKIEAATRSHIGHDDRVSALLNGLWVLTASVDRTIIIWDSSSGKIIHQWLSSSSEVSCIAISPDSQHFIFGGGDEMLTIGYISSSQPYGPHQPTSLKGHANLVSTCAWSPGGATIASGSVEGAICLWDALSSQLLHPIEHAHARATRITQFSPDGRWLASYGEDDRYCIWDRVSAHPLMYIKPILGPAWTGGFQCFSFHPKGAFATLSRTSVHIWDVDAEEERATWKSQDRLLKTVAFSADEKLGLSLSLNSPIVKVWNVSSNTLRVSLVGHAGEVLTACISPCGKYIASGSRDMTVRLWRVADGSCAAVLSGHGSSVEHVKFSPDGTLLSSAEEAGGICIRRFAQLMRSA